MHPDGTPLFCASRSKKRRPFTPEEDAALKAGYDKHGTVWATIVKDPIFQDQNRRSTDLRDRFRNAWPELYAKAGYKPRATAGKKKRLAEGEMGEVGVSSQSGRLQPARAATDDQLPTTSTMSGPIRRKRRHTTQGFGLFRGGVKSVPESMTNSEDEESGSEDEVELSQTADLTGTSGHDMDVEVSSTDLGAPDFASSSSLTMSDITDSSQSQSQSGVASWPDIDSTSHPWSSSRTPNAAFTDSLAASPTPSTDYLLPHSPVGLAPNSMIGKSAWGTQDWLSPNPRLDASGFSPSNGNTFTNSGLFSPSPIGSPSVYAANQSHSLSLAHVSLNHLSLPGSHSHNPGGYAHSHGVVDRYDLFPMSHDLDLDLDFVSEGFGGTGDAHSAFSDPAAWAGTSDMRRGFTHHSNYAGDLIFGARTHQPTGHARMDYGPGFGFGLGLEGVQPSSVLHTPALPGIDEIELTNITLEDPREPDQEMPLNLTMEDRPDALSGATAGELLASGVSSPSSGSQESFMPLALDELVGIPSSDPIDEPHAAQGVVDSTPDTSNHITPPATPAMGYRVSARTPGFSTAHHRSISVPPSEHRAFLPPRTGQSQAVSPKAKHKSLMATPTRTAFAVPLLPPSAMAQQHSGHIPSAWPHNPSETDTYRVPFLDLHYYYPPGIDAQLASHASAAPPASGAHALDLAHTFAQTLSQPSMSGPKPLCIPPSLMQLVPDPNLSNGHSRGSSHHQRGQSVVVSPQDLELRKGNDNKRKRASWDGGPR